MRSRVRVGQPERCDTQIGGLNAFGYQWTDGVADVLSYFVGISPSAGVEIEVSCSDHVANRQDVRDVASTLLPAIRWRDVVEGAGGPGTGVDREHERG